MEFQVKRATIEDANSIAQLFDAYRVFYKQKSDIALAEKFISKRLHNNESVIFFAISKQGEMLGFTQLYPSFSSVSAKRTWILNDLFVIKTARRLGVAGALMASVKDFGKSTHAKGIGLETATDNSPAQALYESLGYRKNDGFYRYFLTL